jgi:hypothetical protein
MKFPRIGTIPVRFFLFIPAYPRYIPADIPALQNPENPYII